jgi:hypothetical protein
MVPGNSPTFNAPTPSRGPKEATRWTSGHSPRGRNDRLMSVLQSASSTRSGFDSLKHSLGLPSPRTPSVRPFRATSLGDLSDGTPGLLNQRNVANHPTT